MAVVRKRWKQRQGCGGRGGGKGQQGCGGSGIGKQGGGGGKGGEEEAMATNATRRRW